MILIFPLLYLFICWIAGNVWFDWNQFLICIGIGAVWDVITAAWNDIVCG